MDEQTIIKNFETSIKIKQVILEDLSLIKTIKTIVKLIIATYKNNGKILFCGNGGSAADAQHLAAEFSGRYYFDRPPLPAEALHVNTSYITAVANDYSYNEIYARLIKAIGCKNDVLIGLSTSGNSQNIVNALKQAQLMDINTIGLTGINGGKMKNYCNHLINIPSLDTPRIQEAHMLIGHTICELVERSLFKK